MIVRCSQCGPPVVAGHTAVRQDHVEFRPLQRRKKRVAAIDRQDVAVEAALCERQPHHLGIGEIVFQMQYPQLHVRVPVATNTQDYGYWTVSPPSNLQLSM